MSAVSDLIFPSAAAQPSFSQLLGDLRRSNLSVPNRLRSIRRDAGFAREVRAAYAGRPLVANERCGSWYVEPALKAASAYFKSTDGHTGQWKFSTRRLNLHLLRLIGENDGIIIVDSTRRGKLMPDALSKTVPIWCCVLNRVLFPSASPAAHDLCVPPNVVSASERSQMLARIPGFVASLTELGLDLEPLRAQVSKPLRPVWVTPESGLPDGPAGSGAIFDDYHPVVCCTASRRVAGSGGGAEADEAGGYIQGAGDDTENWALGLTPTVFWEHAEELLAATEAELPGLIATLVAASAGQKEGGTSADSRKQLTPRVFVCPLSTCGEKPPGPKWCTVALTPGTTKPEEWVKEPSRLEVGIGKHKVASRNLRQALPHICSFVREFLAAEEGEVAGGTDGQQAEQLQRRVLIACESGKDISAGVALAVLCWCLDGDGQPRKTPPEDGSFNKTVIRARLGRIMTAMPDANPSRTTLQSVNSFLMDWRR